MTLKYLVTIEEVFSTKLWLVPRAGLFGQVLFNGLHWVHVCARDRVVKNVRTERSDRKSIVKEGLSRWRAKSSLKKVRRQYLEGSEGLHKSHGKECVMKIEIREGLGIG